MKCWGNHGSGSGHPRKLDRRDHGRRPTSDLYTEKEGPQRELRRITQHGVGE